MSSYDEWYEAIKSDDPVRKYELMHKRMEKIRASSKASPEATEDVLAAYERASLSNLKIDDRNIAFYEQQMSLAFKEHDRQNREDRIRSFLPRTVGDVIVCILAAAFVILSYALSR